MTEQEANIAKIDRLRRHLSRMDRADAEMREIAREEVETIFLLGEMRVDMLTELVERLSTQLHEVEKNAEDMVEDLKAKVGRYQHLANRVPYMSYIIAMSETTRGGLGLKPPSLFRVTSDELLTDTSITDLMYLHGYCEDTHTITIELMTDIPDIC